MGIRDYVFRPTIEPLWVFNILHRNDLENPTHKHCMSSVCSLRGKAENLCWYIKQKRQDKLFWNPMPFV